MSLISYLLPLSGLSLISFPEDRMAVSAYINHHLPGRLRLRIPAVKGEEDRLRELSSAIAKTPGISQVEYNPIIGSILIQYSPEQYENLQSLKSSLSASSVPIALRSTSEPAHRPHPQRRRGRSTAARRVDSFFRELDSEIRDATDNEIDLKFILPFGVGVLGLLALRYSSTTPLWLTLLIFAFHSFLGLHAPSGAEIAAAESLVELEA
jgi:heavy-metal-associated domain-containing protein